MLNQIDPTLCRIMKKNLVEDYLFNIHDKVMESKKSKINNLEYRGTHQTLMLLRELGSDQLDLVQKIKQ